MDQKSNLSLPLYLDNESNESEKLLYEKKTSFLSKLFFGWTSPLFRLSKQKKISLKTLSNTKRNPLISSINEKELFEPYKKLKNYYKSAKYKTYHNLLFSILRANIYDVFIVLSLSLSLTLLGFFRVNVLRKFMIIFETSYGEQFDKMSLVLISIIFIVVRFGQILILQYNDFLCENLCNKTRGQLTLLIYEKMLKTSDFIKKSFNRGRIINYLQSDIETINFLFYYSPMTLFVPFQIAFNMILLFQLFGISFIWSFSTFVILISIAWIIEYFYIKTKKKLLQNNDDRIKATSSILQNIKAIKMYTLESLFYGIIKKKRENEMNNYTKIENIFVLTDFLHWLIPLLLSVVSVGVELFSQDEINMKNIIIAIEIYDNLAYPLFRIPIFIASLLNTLLSMTRIENYLNEENINGKKELEEGEDKSMSKSEDDDQYSIIIENTNFGIKGSNSNNDKILLHNINLKIKKGSIVGILGETGSGKTNLVYGILRHFNIIQKKNKNLSNSINIINIKDSDENLGAQEELIENEEQKETQRMVINGKISYASQIPFIINDTVKNNIIFYNEGKNESKFQEVIDICQLADDLKLFRANEYSEVSPGGANLSGGQKARICLARAIYNDADIYILDDPISSVDPIVFNKIYGNLLLNYLKNKTRIILQHDHNFIQHMEYIYYLNEGSIVFSGTYDEFIKTDWYKRMKLNETQLLKINPNKDEKNKAMLIKKSERKISIETNNIKAFIAKGKVVVEESANKGGIEFQLYTKLLYFMGNKSYLLPIFVLIFSLFWQGLQVMGNQWLTKWNEKIGDKNIFENKKSKREYQHAVLYYYIIYCLIGSFSIFFLFNKEFLLTRAIIYISSLLHNDMIKHLIRAPINKFHNRVPLGRIINVLNFDLERCKVIVKIYGNMMRGIASFLASACICWYYNKYSLYFIPILIIICVYILNISIECSRDINRVECIARTPILNNYNETLNGIVSIRAFNKENRFFKKLKQNIFEHFLICIYKNGVNDRFLLKLELYSFCYLIFIVIYINYDPSIVSALSLGILLKHTISFCEQLCFFFKQVGFTQNEMVHFERCDEFCKIEEENYFPKRPGGPNLKENFTIEIPQIEFNKYSATYLEGNEVILKNINLTINPKEKIGIVGRTGSGKSSLINAIIRIFESKEGKILISGKDISRIPLIQLRKEICIVPQEPFLFDGTLRENIDPNAQFSDGQIKKVLNKLNFNWKLIGDSYNNKLDFHVSENGSNFSLGEKQLICFARAILQKKKIVVFDEVTSNCDVSSEGLINECIQNDFKDSTVLIITHKLANVMNYDKVLVLDKGKMKEFDNPLTLYHIPGSAFKELCDNEKRYLKHPN